MVVGARHGPPIDARPLGRVRSCPGGVLPRPAQVHRPNHPLRTHPTAEHAGGHLAEPVRSPNRSVFIRRAINLRHTEFSHSEYVRVALPHRPRHHGDDLDTDLDVEHHHDDALTRRHAGSVCPQTGMFHPAVDSAR